MGRMMRALVGPGGLCLFLMAGAGVAGPAGMDAAALRQTLPQSVQARMAADPVGFRQKLAQLAAHFGDGGELTAASFERMAAAGRARTAAAAAARLMAADLDGDGAVSRAERDAALQFLPGARQKRFGDAWAQADADKDGLVSADELAGHAREAARQPAAAARAEGWMALMALDANADGKLSPAEVDAALAGLPARVSPAPRDGGDGARTACGTTDSAVGTGAGGAAGEADPAAGG